MVSNFANPCAPARILELTTEDWRLVGWYVFCSKPGMGEMKTVGDLRVSEEIRFEKKEWTAQRIGWIAMGVILVAALLGLLGGGPLGRATAGDERSGLWVQYDRFARNTARSELTIHVERGREIRLWISNDYLRSMQVKEILPEPDEVRSLPDRMLFVFHAVQAPAVILVSMETRRVGRVPAQIGLENGPRVQFRQFIYP